MANSRGLTMKAKKSTAVFGVVAVVLLLSKFFPRVYGNILNRVGTATNMDASRTSEIINGVIFLSLGLAWFMLSKVFSYSPLYKQAWSISGLALVGIGGLLIAGQNPFRGSDAFDLTGYQG
jgi:hypothetical protein